MALKYLKDVWTAPTSQSFFGLITCSKVQGVHKVIA